MTDEETAPNNELTTLGAFIQERSRDTLDHALGVEVELIGQSHSPAESACAAGHYPGENWPCEEWHRGVVLAVAWLRDRIEKLEAAPRRDGD